MKNHFGRFLLVFLICGLCALAYFKKQPPLGLDLAGGSSLTYDVRSGDGGELTPERMQRAIRVIDGRLNATGVTEISILPTQQNEIVIELPGRTAEQIKDIKDLVNRNGILEFRIRADPADERNWRDVYESSGGKVLPTTKDLMWLPQKDERLPAILVKTPERPLKDEMDKVSRKLLAASAEFKAAQEKVDAAARDESVPSAQRTKLREDLDALRKRLQFESPDYRAALAKYEAVAKDEFFTGDQLAHTGIVRQTAQIVVEFEFKDEFKPYFGQFTEKYVGQYMAIVLDGKVNSYPVIKSKLPGQGIIEGGGNIGFSEKDASELAVVLESGSTGVTLTLAREESLGPSLGEVAISRGKWSIIIGFGLVVGLMVFYYRMPGMVANFALLLNLVILMGVLAFFRAALTLPGIAGIVLTLGMAVDANILIFERYREERHRGKAVPEALAAGYDRALSAIIDSNATTILTAVVLIVMGTGSVKGFGVTLTVGLLASMFTSILVTRWIFEWALEKGVAKDLVLGPDKKTPTIDYMRNRKWFTGPSFVLMILGAVAYLVRDDYDKRDLEFVGGQEAIVHLAKPITPKQADELVKADKRFADASIVTLTPEGVDAKAGETNRFRVRAKAQTQKDGEEFVAYLSAAFSSQLVPEPYVDVNVQRLKTGGVKATLALNVVGSPADPAKLKDLLATTGFTEVDVQKDAASATVLRLTVTDASPNASAETVKTRVGEAVKKADPKITLSDPFPAKSFLEKSRAEDLYRSAVWAIIVSLLIQIVYIRLRFANYNYGVAAVTALAHDVPIALGAVTVCDMSGLVYAKVNLVLIAAFLTLIGYSMNDTIVIYDRIRENLGRSKVIRSAIINEAVNQTLVRSIRTSMTVWVVVLVQFFFSRGTGSVLEGFAFVMVVGVLSGTYSSIFIAAPLLLFLPHYWTKLAARPSLAAAMAVATPVGAIMAMTSRSGTPQFWIGVLLAFSLVIHFLVHFFPWLGHKDPDEFVSEQIEAEARERPVEKPGI